MDRARDWWARRKLWQKVVIVLFGIGFVGSPFVEDENLAEPAPARNASTSTSAGDTSTTTGDTPTTSATAAVSATTAPPTTAAPPVTSSTSSSPTFDVIAEDDISFAGTVRTSLRVTVAAGTTKAQLTDIAAQLVAEYRHKAPYQALNIFFYHFPELTQDIASLGVWEDAPFGEWGRASDVELGDYSKHEPVDKTKDKDWSKLPSSDEVAIYVAYNEIYDDLASTSDDLPSDDDILAIIAEARGLPIEDVEAATLNVLSWLVN